jgi:tetratricopeptide (TPR) repeat protein
MLIRSTYRGENPGVPEGSEDSMSRPRRQQKRKGQRESQSAPVPSWWGLIVVLLIGAASIWMIQRVRQGEDSRERGEIQARDVSTRRHLAAAREALARQDYLQAEEAARLALEGNPELPAALLVAGEAAVRLQHHEDALRYFARVTRDESRDSTEESLSALAAAGGILVHQGGLKEAEAHFQRVLKHRPDHLVAHRFLAFLYSAQGRNREAREHLMELVRQGEFSQEELFLLTHSEQTVDHRELLELSLERTPDYLIPQLGLARLARENGDLEEALLLVNQVVEAEPPGVPPAGRLEARVLQGELLEQLGRLDALSDWQAGLPSEADEHPEVWHLRGRWAQEQDDLRSAARCYWEAVRRDPNHTSAHYRLSQVLKSLNRNDDARQFLRRSQLLNELLATVDPLGGHQFDRERMLKVATLAESLGRPWEAWAWCHVVLRHLPQDSSARALWNRLVEPLRSFPPQTLPSAQLALTVDLSSEPLPTWVRLERGDATTPASTGPATIQFSDLAAAAGIDFQYFNSADPQVEGLQLFQQLGGGIAVLDFDGDGWPDVYLSQGCVWPPEPGQTEYRDCLYRNLGNGAFEEVSLHAGIIGEGFGQGVAIGDLTNDGFPDIYVANIGGNRLFLNNGDGTFSEVTAEAGLEGMQWTSSCLIADLNGDGLPDLYDVNYLDEEALVKVCRDEGRIRACSPTVLDAEPDRLWLNQGDGRFEEVSRQAGIVGRQGKGLGIVAADFEHTGRLNLFIANDTTANHYYMNRTSEPGEPPQFDEVALTTGLAFDANGRSQACMGIAIDDATGDGLLDILVTNFRNEANAFYRQRSAGLFVDAVRQAGLYDISFPELGFGTQFLDADLDGRPDLMVANGHIDDFRHRGEPFQMRTQFLHNLGPGRFAELSSETLGDYFTGRYLGRSVARIDWNRDGRDDVLVMHLDHPVSLLTNQTMESGNFLALHFRGTESSRDAIGTRVELSAGETTYHRQLTAGDGFQASNQRRLTCGLGHVSQVDRLTVHWPSGRQQVFEDLAVNQELILVEGHDSPIVLPLPAR